MGDCPDRLKPRLPAHGRACRPMMTVWAREFNRDRVPAITDADGSRLRLLSRNGNGMTASYPELGIVAGWVAHPGHLDGEILAIRAGRPELALLQADGRPTQGDMRG